jgi:VCBS repeat-containing protein
MAESKAPTHWKLITVALTASVSLIGFLGNTLWSNVSDKLDAISTNQNSIIKLEQQVDSDEAQWQIIKAQNEKITALEVEVEVLERLVTTYSSDANNKTITVNLRGMNDAALGFEGDGKSSSPGSDDFDIEDGGETGDINPAPIVKPPKPLIKKKEPDYDKILDDLDKIQEEEIDEYKQRAIQLQQRQNKK